METHESSQPRIEALSRLLETLRDEVAILKAIRGDPPSRVANIKTIEAEIALLEEIEKQWRDRAPAPRKSPDFMTALAMAYSLRKGVSFTLSNELLESAEKYSLQIEERVDGLGYDLTVRDK